MHIIIIAIAIIYKPCTSAHSTHTHAETTACRYEYTEQPPVSLDCNPFPVSVLRVGCTISYRQTDPAVALRWLFYPNSNSQTPLIISQSTSKYTVGLITITGSVESILQVSPLLDADIGGYACQAVFSNGTALTESQQLVLFSGNAFTALGFSTCSRTDEHTTRNPTRCASSGSGSNGNITPTSSPSTMGNNPGGGGFSIFGPNSGIILACIGIGVFLVITAFIIILCFVFFQCCKYFD